MQVGPNVADGYYWRIFNGQIPSDALIAGKDKDGLPIYIGQVLYNDKLLPAKIYTNDRLAYFAWNSEQSTDKNVKILCTPYPERFSWAQTKKNEIHMLINQYIISGGHESNYVLYIGRAFYNYETTVGRVRTGERATQNQGLIVSTDGREQSFESFEILTYNPTAEPTGTKYCHRNMLFISN